MTPTKSYDNMTADELDAVLIDMNNALQEQRQKILEVHAIYDQKRSVENALRRLDGLSPAEMEALLTHVATQKKQAAEDDS